jgi:DMSO/TMAO reductase YedYZ molybdopterin-dependent catalytic subunit
VLAAAVALGAGELVAGLVGPRSSPVVAVADTVVALTPEAVKDAAIRTFGSNDKHALVVGTLVVTCLYAAAVGIAAARRWRVGATGVALFGLVGIVAAVTRPGAGAVEGLPSFAAAVAGVLALRWLVPERSPEPETGLETGLGTGAGTGLDRRQFLAAGGIALGTAVVTAGGGRLLDRRFDVAAERSRLTLPAPASPAPALPAGADLSRQVRGLTPLVTATRSFYRVDTAITVPQLRPADYRLALTGMFGGGGSLTLQDLYRRDDLIERDITLTCVSNEVGGDLAGNARWLGVPLGTFLREHGLDPAATQLVCRSDDGMTIGASARAALETPDAMLAIGMNGRPLPVAHGFPVRMVVPGQYGYVSACKWLTGIEATTYDAYDAYWVRRGWTREGPIKVASRIDTPADGRGVAVGRRAVAGVAWAQGRGIARVEVRVDDGGWTEARLAPDPGADVWRQWVLPVDLAAGRHRIAVRATTADGELQTDHPAEPFPDGATGWHQVEVLAT